MIAKFFLHSFGGETAEWDLRGIIQRHGNISYLFAGSREHLIHRMILNKGALHKLFDKMPFGPMDAEYLANWIDSRLSSAGIKAAKVGADIAGAAGPRTRDIVQVARKCFDLTHSKGMATCFHKQALKRRCRLKRQGNAVSV